MVRLLWYILTFLDLTFIFLLQELNLSGNEITKTGACVVAECMEDKPNLEVLDLNCMYHALHGQKNY